MAQLAHLEQVTPADELRNLLTLVEKRLANVRGSGGEFARALLDELDRIAALWPQLEAQGMDLRPEAGRWATIQQTALHKAGPVLAELKSLGGIEHLRRVAHPQGTDALWWNLDAYTRQRQSRIMRRALLAAAGVVVVGVGLYFLLRFLFPVDPGVQEAVRRVAAGEQLVSQGGNFAAALAEFEAAAQATPDDPDVWLRVGAARGQAGDATAAQEAFDRARQLSSSDLDFFRARAAAYLALGLVDPADADLQAALGLKPDDAQSWYLLANVFEARGQLQDAVAALEKADEYASETDQAELTAMARFRMGILMQQMQLSVPTAATTVAPATPAP